MNISLKVSYMHTMSYLFCFCFHIPVCDNYSKLSPLIDGMPGVEPVVKAYIHAALAAHPNQRYVIGADAHVVRFVSSLPSCIFNWIMDRPLKMLDIPLPRVLRKRQGLETNGIKRKSSVGHKI